MIRDNSKIETKNLLEAKHCVIQYYRKMIIVFYSSFKKPRVIGKVVCKCKPDNTFKKNTIAVLTWREFNSTSTYGSPAALCVS